MEKHECLACGFIVELEHGVSIKQCPGCQRFYDKVKSHIDKGLSITELSINPIDIAKTKSHNPITIESIVTLEKECPFCSELIKNTAKKCKHCGEILDVVLRAADDSKKTQNVYMNSSSAAVAVTEPKKFPHLLHFFISVITGGLWIVVWIIHYLAKGRG